MVNAAKQQAKRGNSGRDTESTPLKQHSKSTKKQLDGSKVESPPSDPVNSEETLKRNRIGNS